MTPSTRRTHWTIQASQGAWTLSYDGLRIAMSTDPLALVAMVASATTAGPQ